MYRIDIGQFIVRSKEQLGILEASDIIKGAQTKSKQSGQWFTFRGQRVQVWLRGHYLSKEAR